jgi:Fic family protein
MMSVKPHEIETIHPFEDGNGRMGRLWQTLLLARWNAIFAWIPMESVLQQNRQQYYQAIEHAREANDSGVFIEFTLSALFDVISAQEKQSLKDKKLADKLPINVADKLTVAEVEFVKLLEPYFKENKWIGNAKAREITNKAEGSVKRFLRNLTDKGVFEIRGENKSRQYCLKK